MHNPDKASKIDTLAQLYAPEDKYKLHYKVVTAQYLVVVLSVVVLFFADHFILPNPQTPDTIIRYQEIISHNQKHLGFRYYTEEGFAFFKSGGFIEDYHITIEHSFIFKNIHKVITPWREHSQGFTSDIKETNFYIIWLLGISSIISILCLLYYKGLSDNGFLNIVLFNSLLVIYVVVFLMMSW
jgi:hypothetical protein